MGAIRAIAPDQQPWKAHYKPGSLISGLHVGISNGWAVLGEPSSRTIARRSPATAASAFVPTPSINLTRRVSPTMVAIAFLVRTIMQDKHADNLLVFWDRDSYVL
jgi:hypothetical protein